MTAFQKAWEMVIGQDPMLQNIIKTTLEMAFTSSILALLFGVLIGLVVAYNNFPGKKVVVVILRTLMGLN